MTKEALKIEPTEPQAMFCANPADIAIYGGAAGGGKSFALLLEASRHVNVASFGAVILRRTYTRIKQKGGLWEESRNIYHAIGGRSLEYRLMWVWPNKASIRFAHLEHDSRLEDWHGAQIPLLCFDELQEFSERAFFYLMSRNRSTCEVRPYIRATCNPDSESWLAEFLSWWIDQDTGYAIPERQGQVRWMQRVGETLYWADSKPQLKKQIQGMINEEDFIPKSVSFIPAKLADNPWLLKKSPEYRANLLALPLVDRERLLEGNWKIRPSTGVMFPRDKWKFVDAVPAGARYIRAWDKAGTEGGKGARTAGVLMAFHEGRFFVVDAVAGRWSDVERDSTIRNTAEVDTAAHGHVEIWIEQEGGSGGKQSALISIRQLAGFDVHAETATGDKATRWRPYAAQVQAGNVWIVRGSWDFGDYIRELDYLSGDQKLDTGRLKDLADASALAFNHLALHLSGAIDGDLLVSTGMGRLSEDEEREMEPWLKELIDSSRESTQDRERDYDEWGNL